MITQEDVKKIAKLARLHLSEKEVKKFTEQLGGILKYAEILKEVDTEGIEPIAQITHLQNVRGGDKTIPCSLNEELLNCSSQPTQNNMIQVKNVF